MATAGNSTPERIALGAAVAMSAAGSLVLLGQLAGLPVLDGILPGLRPVSVSLAVALVLAGGALGLRAGWPDDVRARLAAAAVAGAAAILGVLQATQAVDGSWAAGAAVAIGSLSLVVITSDRISRLHSGLVVLMAGLLLVSMAGFAIDPGRFAETSRTTGIGLAALVPLIVFCAGSAALRPDRGLAALLFPEGPRKGIAWLAWALVLVPSIGLAALAVAAFAVVTVAVDAARNRYYKVDSDRRQAIRNLKTREERLREAQTRYQGLLEATPDAIIVVRSNGRIVLANEHSEEVFGHPREDLIGKPIEELIPQRFRFAHRGHREAFMEDPHTRPMGAELDLWAVRADGTEFPVEISLSVTRTDDDGELVTAAVRDITARRQAEATLRQTEQRFRGAFEDAPIGMAITATDGRFIRVNKALCEITGYSRDQLEATSFASISDPADLDSYRDAVARMIAGDIGSFRGEQGLIHTDGRAIPVELTTTLIRSGNDAEPSHFLAQVQDITDRKRFEGQLQYLADHDALTGLYNRRRFDEELGRELARSGRAGAECCVLALDLDNFKYLNDSLGHSAGDELISQISHLLREKIRETDVIARLGGDEFALILPNTTTAGAVKLAEELRDVVKNGAEVQVGRSSTRVTVSIGIAPVPPDGKITAEEAMVEADIAMYDAKEAGRDCAAVFEASKDRQRTMEARLTWVQRIREAIEEDGFVLYAQPILGLDGDRRPRHELLLRMKGEDGDMIPPGTFLHIAERFDLIRPIDRWVVRKGIALLAEQQRLKHEVVLEINLSAKSVTDPDLPAFIKGEIESSGADPRGLCFEITETAAIVNVDRAKVFARDLTALGCEFALDDFGAGFASFYYLKHLEFDYLKIDGEFIRDLTTSKTNQLVVQSVVDIARGLGKRTIAEFVEDAKTLKILREFDVNYAQGFHIARPTPIEELLLDGASEPAVPVP